MGDILNKLIGGVASVAVGKESENYSRKWILLAGLAAVAYFHPGFTPPEWLLTIAKFWMGAQGVTDAAAAFKAAKPTA